jgi:hypothetical protein
MRFLATFFVVSLVFGMAASCHAGSCHGTPSKAATPVAVEPTHVGVSVDVETPTPAGVETSVQVNGEAVTPVGCAPAAKPSAVGDVGFGAAVRNARREKRATIREASDTRRAKRFAGKASEAAAEAAVNERVRQAYE